MECPLYLSATFIFYYKLPGGIGIIILILSVNVPNIWHKSLVMTVKNIYEEIGEFNQLTEIGCSLHSL